MSSIVAIENVKPGMVIVQITKQNGPVKIRKSGLVTSDAMVQGLSEMGVQEVEIDPEQTVEIAPTVRYKTQTQALLRGQHDTTAKFDKSLNEQFNRSLFLPTVEGLPSAWKIYTKQVASFAIVIAGGLAIGFSLATTQHWWPSIADIGSKTTPTEVATSVDASGDEQTMSMATAQKEGDAKQTSTVTEPAATQKLGDDTQTLTSAQNNTASNNINNDISNTQNASENTLASNTSSYEPNRSDSQYASNNSANINGQSSTADTPLENPPKSDEYEGKVLNESQENSDVKVSPELMARFNAAVEALDSNAQDDNFNDTQTKVTVRDDIPRVDQLPVRLLTRLPSMNFSAHMYASRPADRWVRVNGQQMGEGDWIADRVQIVNIEAQKVVLSFEDEIFTMAALTDW